MYLFSTTHQRNMLLIRFTCHFLVDSTKEGESWKRSCCWHQKPIIVLPTEAQINRMLRTTIFVVLISSKSLNVECTVPVPCMTPPLSLNVTLDRPWTIKVLPMSTDTAVVPCLLRRMANSCYIGNFNCRFFFFNDFLYTFIRSQKI